MALKEVFVPDIGNYKDVDVIELLVKVGDTITQEQSLLTLETDKATMEIPSSEAGVIKEICVKPGSKISQGSLVLRLEAAGEAAAEPIATPAVAKTPEAAPAPATAPVKVEAPHKETYIHAGPAVRQLARELSIDLNAVTGTGLKGRITREDLNAKIKSQISGSSGAGLGLLPDPIVNFEDFGTVRVEKTPRIKKISGAALTRNAIRIPHITLFDEADMTDLESFRVAKKPDAEKAGVKLTPVPFLVKAVASALRAYPIVNSALSNDGENLIFKEYVHVGVAVDTPHGLMVPVIRDADQKGLYQIAKELADLGARAKEGKLKPEEMKGGCFTISSLGGLGTTAFTPIVNMPEVAILGVSRAEIKPKWNGKEFLPRLMLPLSLSLDHRVVDGADGARFLAHLVKVLSDLRELVL
ncbi:MAG: 2-oxo acid dehydrogenase subunit E2 [Gammaproteobacteria bacterium]|nr:2-oxo acid dehydrogenase subunit E2 [Gammaproteobacteria bacterium]